MLNLGLRTRVGTVGAYTTGSNLDVVLQAREFIGAVTVSGRTGLGALGALARRGELYGVDLDPACYLESPRAQGELFARDCEDDQRRLGLPIIRSAGSYVGRADLEALRHAFTTPVGAGTIRVISLHGGWLRLDALPNVLSFVRGSSDSLAFVLADPFDPLSARGAVDGLQELLAAASPDERRVELLRTDIAGLGFAAAGGRFGAIGLSSTTRHHSLPLGRNAGRDFERRRGTPKLFVPQLLSWQQGTVLGALTPFGGAGLTECACVPCGGSDLLRFDQQWPGSVPEEIRAEARDHDLHSWGTLSTGVLADSDPMLAWRSACMAATRTTAEIADMYKVQLTIPESVRAWV